MEIRETNSSRSAGWYLLGGLIVGAAAGLLLAPQSGDDTREDLEAWRRRAAERGRSLIASLGDALPSMAGAGEREAASAGRDGRRPLRRS
jgi:gas vesicle protein